MKNALIGSLVVALVAVIAWAFLYKDKTRTEKTNPSPIVYASATPSVVPFKTIEETPTAIASKGSISGKLCYPSSFLPSGSIEAKNVKTAETTSINYPGSQNGGKSTYSLDLSAGTYILRYKAQSSPNTYLYGYHTETCSTGAETTCAANNPQTNIQIEVKPGEAVKDVDLCDFYYDPKKAPSF